MWACMATSTLWSALAVASPSAPVAFEGETVAQLLTLQALIGNDTDPVSEGWLESDACAVRLLSGVLLYRREPNKYRNALFAELVVDDYAERSAGKYNDIDVEEAVSVMDAASSVPREITDQRIRMVAGFCALKDKNLWTTAGNGSRLSLARFFRGAALSSLLKGTDEDTVAITSAIDAHTASRHDSVAP